MKTDPKGIVSALRRAVREGNRGMEDQLAEEITEGLKRLDAIESSATGANPVAETPEPSREWLERMAKLEDEAGSISVGGLASDLGLYRAPSIPVDVLRRHFLTAVECDHEAKTDTARCFCAVWTGKPQPSVGAAVEEWIAHIVAHCPVAETGALGEPDGWHDRWVRLCELAGRDALDAPGGWGSATLATMSLIEQSIEATGRRAQQDDSGSGR